MESKTLEDLICRLPQLEKSSEGGLQQLDYLIKIATRLGLTAGARFLNGELSYFRRWHGPKPIHPEQRSGEVHLLNSDPETVRYIGWKTKRAGEVALDFDANIVAGQVPVFVAAKELKAAGQLDERMSVAP
jgi:hypothetical protein